MARTIPEIFNTLVAEKESLSTLKELTGGTSDSMTPYLKLLSDVGSKSRVAAWRLMLFIVAAGSWVLESLWDAFRSEVTAKADEAISGTINWYLRKIYEFQYGGSYQYELINGKFQWSEVVPEDQVIVYVAVMELQGDLIVKAAGQKEGKPVELETTVLNAFVSYLEKFKIAGTACQVISAQADDLTYNLDVYYDPIYSNVKSDVETAIDNYLSSQDFNGRFVITKFVDALQAVQGVEDVFINKLQARYGSLQFSDIIRQYLPNSGYMAVIGGTVLNNVTEGTDRSTITSNSSGVIIKYIPNV